MNKWIPLWFLLCWPAQAWDHAASKSPIDDSTIYQASTPSLDGKHNLIVQCERDTTLLVITYPDHYMSDLGAWGVVTMRVDSSSAMEQSMLVSNDSRSLAQRGGDAIRTLKAMLGGDELFVRALPVNESSLDVRFNISGIDVALKSIREVCGW